MKKKPDFSTANEKGTRIDLTKNLQKSPPTSGTVGQIDVVWIHPLLFTDQLQKLRAISRTWHNDGGSPSKINVPRPRKLIRGKGDFISSPLLRGFSSFCIHAMLWVMVANDRGHFSLPFTCVGIRIMILFVLFPQVLSSFEYEVDYVSTLFDMLAGNENWTNSTNGEIYGVQKYV